MTEVQVDSFPLTPHSQRDRDLSRQGFVMAKDWLISTLQEVDATLCACRYENRIDCNCDIHASHAIIRKAIAKAQSL